MKNFDVGKHIIRLLDINKLNGKIFPLVANAGTEFPFCIYRRTNYQPHNTKDTLDEICDVEIVILSTKYNESVELAKNVAEALNGNSDEAIEEINLMNASESFSSDTFIQTLNFRFIYK